MFPTIVFIVWDKQTKAFVRMPDTNLTRTLETVDEMNKSDDRYVVVNYSLGEEGL